jgi:hypothetical protein
MIEKTAMDGIEQRFPQHPLDRGVLKYPKMKFKVRRCVEATLLWTVLPSSRTARLWPVTIDEGQAELTLCCMISLFLAYQGIPSRSVIRKKKDGSDQAQTSSEVSASLAAQLKREVCSRASRNFEVVRMRTPRLRRSPDLLCIQVLSPVVQLTPAGTKSAVKSKKPASPRDEREPDYKVVYQRNFDIADMRQAPDAGASTWPSVGDCILAA